MFTTVDQLVHDAERARQIGLEVVYVTRQQRPRAGMEMVDLHFFKAAPYDAMPLRLKFLDLISLIRGDDVG